MHQHWGVGVTGQKKIEGEWGLWVELFCGQWAGGCCGTYCGDGAGIQTLLGGRIHRLQPPVGAAKRAHLCVRGV
jgi:hypothetical protein